MGDSGRAEVLCLPIDIDGDGFIDLVSEWGHYGTPPSNSRIYRNDGRMNFTDITTECGLSLTGMSIKGAGDVNHDGYPDLFVLENRVPQIYLSDGRGKFAKQPGALVGTDEATRPAYASWGMAVVTDFDNDGVADILWNGRHFLWVLRGTGDGRFEYMNDAWGIKDASAASVDDGVAAPQLFARLEGQPMGKVTRMFADSKYNNLKLYEWIDANAKWDLKIVSRPEGKKGWVKLPIRWTVERTFAWLVRCRRLSKDREKSVLSSESFVKLAMIQLMLHRLEPSEGDAEFRYPRPAAA